jgi:hypothetical protein
MPERRKTCGWVVSLVWDADDDCKQSHAKSADSRAFGNIALMRADVCMASANAADSPGKRARSSPHQSIGNSLSPTSIVWYRDFDLRLHDHQPLTHAARLGAVIPVFIWPATRGPLQLGGAAQVQTM